MTAALRKMISLRALASAAVTAGANGDSTKRRPQAQHQAQHQAQAQQEQLEHVQPAARKAVVPQPGRAPLKPRKKAFLQRKRMKKVGRQDPASKAALAGHVPAIRPRLSEPASAPLAWQLKRKHWAASEGTEPGASSRRCSQMFEHQMQTARGTAAPAAPDQGAAIKKRRGHPSRIQSAGDMRQQVVDGYRQQQTARLEAAGITPLRPALQSLAALVHQPTSK